MCGRYSLAISPSLIRQMLEDDGVPIADAPDDEGSEAPHQSYNFAPGSNGVVCTAGTHHRGTQPTLNDSHTSTPDCEPHQTKKDPQEHGGEEVEFKLQSMNWGIVPSWSSKNAASTPKAINCRDDSLRTPGGMWQSMKTRKRCIVVAQGFFEWLHVSPKEKVPHFVKRRDGRLMCFAGLWDAIKHEDTGDKRYTYSIITTSSNEQLRFLHNRMPVIFDADSKNFRQWLNPQQTRWTHDLQSLLKPYEGDLEVYPVCKDVGKVGRSSPSFILPLSDKGNGRDIARFFSSTSQNSEPKKPTGMGKYENEGDQDTSITSAKLSPVERAETNKKHKISDVSSPTSKRRQVKPGPPGVKKITDFFS
ncbi:hypothetical protein H0G86_007822 [Trichoderma simmonsii]|uniref:DUF159 domain protein n=2 Tax=Trichoderma simmonsii TaxID=1491479 RepID=A0A8G0LE89_9HYPO|nr:hypothetical protein H0G86_007822 [Trichoderma simmonsii]